MRVPTDLQDKQLLSVKIKESGEELVDIRKASPKTLVHPLLLKNGSKPLVRKTIAKMLNKAQSYLPEGIGLMIRDAYRPMATQRKIYKEFFKRFKRENPNWSEKRIKEEIGKFVADPKSLIHPGHTTGAAVDATLAYTKNGRRLKMKTSKLPYAQQTNINSPRVPEEIKRNRKILYEAMTKSGFVNYPNEWWHYAYGDVFSTARSGKKIALYGTVEQ